jgi:hypothetical protein
MAVTLSGTFTETPRVEVLNEGQSLDLRAVGGTDLDSQTCLQNNTNGFQFLNNVIAVWAASTGQDARSSMVQIKLMLDDMLQHPEVSASRVYEP